MPLSENVYSLKMIIIRKSIDHLSVLICEVLFSLLLHNSMMNKRNTHLFLGAKILYCKVVCGKQDAPSVAFHRMLSGCELVSVYIRHCERRRSCQQWASRTGVSTLSMLYRSWDIDTFTVWWITGDLCLFYKDSITSVLHYIRLNFSHDAISGWLDQ